MYIAGVCLGASFEPTGCLVLVKDDDLLTPHASWTLAWQSVNFGVWHRWNDRGSAMVPCRLSISGALFRC